MHARAAVNGRAQAPWMERLEEPEADDPLRPVQGILTGLATGSLLWLGLAWLVAGTITG